MPGVGVKSQETPVRVGEALVGATTTLIVEIAENSRGAGCEATWLENELGGGLHQAGRGGGYYLSEGRAVDIAIDGRGAIELSVVEGVETLEAELQRFRFAERDGLQ
jgi:hypothetical protein